MADEHHSTSSVQQEAGLLAWIKRKHIYWKLRFRYWRARRIQRRCAHEANARDWGDPNCIKCGKEIR